MNPFLDGLKNRHSRWLTGRLSPSEALGAFPMKPLLDGLKNRHSRWLTGRPSPSEVLGVVPHEILS